MLLTSYLFLVTHQANSDFGGKTFGGVWNTDEINKTRLTKQGIQRLYVQVVQAQKITTTTHIFEPLRMLEALVCIVEKDKMNRQKILKHN